MKQNILAGLALLVVVALAVYTYAYWRKRSRDAPLPDYRILLCLPLREPVDLDPHQLVERYRARWGTSLRCGENPQWADPQKGTRGYLAADDQHSILLTVSARPLGADLMDPLPDSNWHLTALDEAQKATLEGQRGYVMLRYALGSEEPLARVRFTARVLLALLDLLDGAIGYVNVAAQSYVPRETLQAYLPDHPLEPAGLFLLFGNAQFVEEGSGHWVHTHGMEQFGVPDIEVTTAEDNQAHHCWNLLASAAAYMIERGPILKPGHTAELLGDGVIYRIREARVEPNHPYGQCGAIELVKQ
ncbi:MAG: DUF4261 domain-containing protein [Anaerolineae bacterium]|nr:DUF4261 domain-containing protein [Anaerolineae bacterium]